MDLVQVLEFYCPGRAPNREDLFLDWLEDRVKLKLKVVRMPSESMALTNCVYTSTGDQAMLATSKGPHVKMGDYVFKVQASDKCQPGTIALGGMHRRLCQLALSDQIEIASYAPDEKSTMGSLYLTIDFLSKSARQLAPYDAPKIAHSINENFGQQVFTKGQQFVMDFAGNNLLCIVKKVEVMDPTALLAMGTEGEGDKPAPAATEASCGLLISQTNIVLEPAQNSQIQIKGGAK